MAKTTRQRRPSNAAARLAAEQFDKAELHLWGKWMVHLIGDVRDRIRAENIQAATGLTEEQFKAALKRAWPQAEGLRKDFLRRISLAGMTEAQFEGALTAAFCGNGKDRDPVDEEYRREFLQRLPLLTGMQHPDDLDGGIQFTRTTWRSVNLAVADAAANLATVALAMDFSEQDVACADELALILRRAPHVKPEFHTLKLTGPISVLAAKVLRIVDAPFEPDACCVKIAESLKKQNRTSTELVECCIAAGFKKRMAEDRVPRMAEHGLIARTSKTRNAPFALQEDARRLFFPANGKG